jgi:hypothetical protein
MEVSRPAPGQIACQGAYPFEGVPGTLFADHSADCEGGRILDGDYSTYLPSITPVRIPHPRHLQPRANICNVHSTQAPRRKGSRYG